MSDPANRDSSLPTKVWLPCGMLWDGLLLRPREVVPLPTDGGLSVSTLSVSNNAAEDSKAALPRPPLASLAPPQPPLVPDLLPEQPCRSSLALATPQGLAGLRMRRRATPQAMERLLALAVGDDDAHPSNKNCETPSDGADAASVAAATDPASQMPTAGAGPDASDAWRLPAGAHAEQRLPLQGLEPFLIGGIASWLLYSFVRGLL